MTIIELLTSINNNYLVALAVLIGIVVEVIKQSGQVETRWLPLLSGSVGLLFGGVIGLCYGETIMQTAFNGFVVGLIAIGGFDTLKAMWRLPKWLS